MLIANTNLDVTSLTNQGIEELILQLKQELTERENAKIKTARDKAIEALRDFIKLDGFISIETCNIFTDDDGYIRVECTFPQDVKLDLNYPNCINISANQKGSIMYPKLFIFSTDQLQAHYAVCSPIHGNQVAQWIGDSEQEAKAILDAMSDPNAAIYELEYYSPEEL